MKESKGVKWVMLCLTYKSSTVFSAPSPTFMNTSSRVVTDTPKLVIPNSSILSTV